MCNEAGEKRVTLKATEETEVAMEEVKRNPKMLQTSHMDGPQAHFLPIYEEGGRHGSGCACGGGGGGDI